MAQGCLIVFEGIDGTGKTTQRDLLASWLRDLGVPCVVDAQPSSSTAGRILRKAIRAGVRLPSETELRLFLRDRREQARRLVVPALERGEVVLLDRHYLSSVAYQGARGLDPSRILQACLRFSPVADLTVLFDIPPEVALERIGKTREADCFEHLGYLTRVRQIYLEFASQVPHVVVLDAGQPVEVVQRLVRDSVASLLRERGVLPDRGRTGVDPGRGGAHIRGVRP